MYTAFSLTYQTVDYKIWVPRIGSGAVIHLDSFVDSSAI